jgi:hypothetical protein
MHEFILNLLDGRNTKNFKLNQLLLTYINYILDLFQMSLLEFIGFLSLRTANHTSSLFLNNVKEFSSYIFLFHWLHRHITSSFMFMFHFVSTIKVELFLT